MMCCTGKDLQEAAREWKAVNMQWMCGDGTEMRLQLDIERQVG